MLFVGRLQVAPRKAGRSMFLALTGQLDFLATFQVKAFVEPEEATPVENKTRQKLAQLTCYLLQGIFVRRSTPWERDKSLQRTIKGISDRGNCTPDWGALSERVREKCSPSPDKSYMLCPVKHKIYITLFTTKTNLRVVSIHVYMVQYVRNICTHAYVCA